MANDNQPLLHFGEDPEDINQNSSNEQPSTQINFTDTEETSPKEPKKPAATQPSSSTNKAQSVDSTNRNQAPSAAPKQPAVKPVQTPPQQAKQQVKPQVSPIASKPNDSFGKKNLQINLIVVNGAGVVLPQFKVDHTVIKSGQEITFNDSREVYDVTVSADGYKERRVQITQTDLIKGEKRVSLATQLQSLVVSFNTPDGIKRGSIDIDQTNAIYEFVKDASHTDTPLNELVIGGVGGHKPAPTKNPFIPYLIALAVGLVLGIGISSLFTCSGDDDTKDKTEIVSEEGKTEDMEVKDDEVKPDDNAQTLEPQTEDVTAEKESVKEEKEKAEEEKEEAKEEVKEEEKPAMAEADVKYLKDKDVWKRSDAKSDDAKKFLAAFCSGNIDAIIGSNAYNSLPEKQRNGYYNKVYNDLKKINTQSNSDEAKAALRDVCKNGEINLKKILNRIHPMLKK